MAIKRSNDVWKLCDNYGLVFAEFPDHRFMVYLSKWNKPDVRVFGRLMKQDGLWIFSEFSHPGKFYYGVSRARAVLAYLLEHPLTGKEV